MYLYDTGIQTYQPVIMIFIFTVIDQVNPWLIPSRTLAQITQPQSGAQIKIMGTGNPNSHPAMSIRRRVTLWARFPANRLDKALEIPKVAMKEMAAV